MKLRYTPRATRDLAEYLRARNPSAAIAVRDALVGNADRQWLEAHYFASINPIGKLWLNVPAGPNHPDPLLDACIAFCPWYFRGCPSRGEVEMTLRDPERLDLHLYPQVIPTACARLREEARPAFAEMNIWRADLRPLERT